MRALVVLLAAALASLPGHSDDWVRVTVDSRGALWQVDRASIEPFGKWIKAWVRVSADHDLSNGFSKPYKSSLQLVAFDCDGGKLAFLEATNFAEENGISVVSSVTNDAKHPVWGGLRPNSPGERLHNEVCAAARARIR
jgi:hypothetical protein